MSNDKNVKTYLDFFPFFKTLSKMCHYSMTAKKEANTQKKISNNEASIKSFDLQMKTAQQTADVLKVYADIKDAVERIDSHEIVVLIEKLAKVNERSRVISAKLASFDSTWSQ
jgi:hypothetical protein